MERIIDGILFEGKRLPDSWDLSIWEQNGHRELSARNTIEWREVGQLSRDYRYDDLDPVRDAEQIEENRLRSLKKSAQRAQTACRRIIKAEQFDELLTITYRDNQTSRDACKTHFKAWVRLMKKSLPDFRYCASFERQERGAMHVHVATNKLPQHASFKGVKIKAWRLGTECWRSIVGEDNGLVFVGGKTKFGGNRRNLSQAKMAAYVSKYIMKDFEDSPMGANRYSRSNAIEVTKPTHIRLHGASLCEAIAAMFECKDGDVMVSHRVGMWKDSYWLCTEPKYSQ